MKMVDNLNIDFMPSNNYNYLISNIFLLYQFFWSVIASTLPVPAGIFIPVFKMGAAVGRLTGELMAYMCPNGIGSGTFAHKIVPGNSKII